MATATFVQEGNAVDYTPAADAKAGDVVVQNELIGVVRTDTVANASGALAASGVFDFPKATGAGTAIAAGVDVFWDATAQQATADRVGGANKRIGSVVKAATDDDATVRAKLSGPVVNDRIENAIADPGDAGAIPVAGSGTCALVTAGAETRTLADPSFAGHQLLLALDTDGGDCVITAATPVNQAGNNTLTFDDAGDALLLAAVSVGGSLVWRIAANDGVTPSTV